MEIFKWLIAIFWLCFIAYWIFSATKAKKNVRTHQLAKWAWVRILIVVFIILIFQVPFFRQLARGYLFSFPNYSANVVGVILCGLGVALAIWARRHLGRNWGMPMSLKKEPELVTSGPYKYIRNPIYSGMLLALLGTGLVFGLPWLIAFIVAAIYFIFSSKVEEKIMAEQFPQTYPEYKKRTKMLIPFIW